MTKTMPLIEARNRLTKLPEAFERRPEMGAVAVTRRGKPVLAVMSWNLYESIVETLEIMADKKLMAAIRKGIDDIRHGRVTPWNDVKRSLHL
jgi:PHD/YefM family antitoxin component YafN of YafNO toxin-antitoxin module